MAGLCWWAAAMVVVMADANSADPRAELLNAIVPAARAGYNISSRPQNQALAGVATGAEQAISILRSDPGAFAYVGKEALTPGFLREIWDRRDEAASDPV